MAERRLDTLYSYVPLSSPRTIRVLKLLPAWRITASIDIVLRETTVDNFNAAAIEYEALSYVWGERTRTHAIHCQDKIILVTQSCEQALRRLRYKLAPRILWIDAICIDQISNEEKNHQVKVMGEIYSGAARVIIWLGEGPASTLNATFLKAVRRDWRGNGDSIATMHRSRRYRLLDNALHFSLFYYFTDQQRDKLIYHFASAAWFQRIWTIQEFVFAKTIVVACGGALMSWEDFWTKWRSRSFDLDTLSHLYHSAWNVEGRIRLCKAIDPQQSHQLSDKFELSALGSNPYLWLFIFIDHKAADARDKVYALAPIFNQLRLPFPDPDYSKTISEAFEAAAICALKYMKNLDFLFYKGSYPIPSPYLHFLRYKEPYPIGTQDPPTWVPNFSGEIRSASVFEKTRLLSRSKASGDSELDSSFYCDPGSIHLKGFSIGHVLHLGDILRDSAEGMRILDKREYFEPWCRILQDLLKKSMSARERSDILRSAAYFMSHKGFDEADFEAWLLRRTWASSPESIPREGYNRLIVLSSRLIGKTSDEVEQGDLVVLAMGSKVPLVLRPTWIGYQMAGTIDIYSVRNGRKWARECQEGILQTFTVF